MAIPFDPAVLLREARTRTGLSQRAIARRAGTAQSVVARVEIGVTDPSGETLARLLGAAGFELRCELSPAPVGGARRHRPHQGGCGPPPGSP